MHAMTDPTVSMNEIYMRFSGYSTDFYIPFILGTQGIILNLPLVGLGEIDPLIWYAQEATQNSVCENRAM